jgi:ketosteroid isomerase-like protein
MTTTGKTLLIASALAALSASNTVADEKEATEVLSAVHSFHAALTQGDAQAALNLLAQDAVILESGSAQSREEYAREHLGEDIAFAKAVQATRTNEAVYHEAGVAWTTATTHAQGNFNGRKIDSSGVELIVLTKQDGKWRIRAIHWSSHANKSDEIK